METLAHSRLKRLAAAYLRSRGCLVHAEEVRCPIARFRVDVAGWIDRERDGDRPGAAGWPWRRCEPYTVVIECKQSRSDFFRDRATLAPLLRLRDHLRGMQRSIEEQRIKREEPQLRLTATALFAELESWDFAASRLPAYRRVLARIERVERKLYGEVKFFRMAHYALADLLYIAAPRGMIRRAELPIGWGLLECPREALESTGGRDAVDSLIDERPMLRETIAAPPSSRPSRMEHRLRLLRNIAVSATAAAARLSELRSEPGAVV